MPRRAALIGSLVLLILAVPLTAGGSHSWGSYHWARTSNPFTLKLGDNVTSAWDAYLGEASVDWTASSVLDTTVVAGSTKPRPCKPPNGRVEVCSAKYGNNGWLGLAQIWVSGSHITKGAVKVNDTYFTTATYNTPAWRRLVMCQEVGHTFGLDHQDEDFSNPNLGTCMDYTSDPDGPPSNEHPNQHDYDQLETIYTHKDSTTTVGTSTTATGGGNRRDAWGRAIRLDADGRPSLFVRATRTGQVFTFVIWAR
jgi:hypothetical protein